MRKLLMASVLSGCLALGACTNPITGQEVVIPNPFTTPIDPVVVTQIQANTKSICSFLPTAATVAEIITALTGGSAVVNMIATAAQGICNAVTAKSARRGGALPSYAGVAIRGSFVRK